MSGLPQLSAPSDGGRPALRERMEQHAIPYLSQLLHCTPDGAWGAPLTFQVFNDAVKNGPGACILHGSLEQLAQDLEKRNLAGIGVFITVNQTDLAGRSKKHINALRAVWADIDDKMADQPLDLAQVPLTPSLIVDSGHGTHLYWIFPEAIPCDEKRRNEHEAMLRGIQKALENCGADPGACTVERVLRLPGFYNMKREPVLVEVIR